MHVVAESKLGMGPATPPVLETQLKDFHFLVLHVVVAGHRLDKDPANLIATQAYSHLPVYHVAAVGSRLDMALAIPPVLAKLACSRLLVLHVVAGASKIVEVQEKLSSTPTYSHSAVYHAAVAAEVGNPYQVKAPGHHPPTSFHWLNVGAGALA